LSNNPERPSTVEREGFKEGRSVERGQRGEAREKRGETR